MVAKEVEEAFTVWRFVTVDEALLAMKYPETSKAVVEAKENVCNADQVFGVVVPKAVEITLPAIWIG